MSQQPLSRLDQKRALRDPFHRGAERGAPAGMASGPMPGAPGHMSTTPSAPPPARIVVPQARLSVRDAAPGDVLVERSPMAPAGLRLGRSLDDYQAGHFDNLDTLRLRWVEADYFEYVPDPARPFAFHPPGRAPVIPQAMWTNGGSIPAWAQATATILGRSLSPWGFALGYIVHDWEFDAHHHGVSSKSFEDVRDTLMEAVKTMMAEGIGRVTRDDLLFRAIYIGVNSQTALDLWNASPPGPTG